MRFPFDHYPYLLSLCSDPAASFVFAKRIKMKSVPLLLCFALLLTSCKKEEAVISDSTELQQQPGWIMEKFKNDYTIQFPDFYTGGYLQGFEGGSFDKFRNDTRVHAFYNFSNGLQQFDFGDTLADVNATSLDFPEGDRIVYLDKRLNFTDNGEIKGIFFYNSTEGIRNGDLYWNDGAQFKAALTVYYDSGLQDEVITIIATIRHN